MTLLLLLSQTDPEDVPGLPWVAGVADVGRLLRARTRDSNNNEVGTFNSDTRPTGTQVEDTIGLAAWDVAARVGNDPGADFYPMLRSVVSFRAALLVELSYFPEQVDNGQSPYPQLLELYEKTLDELTSTLKDNSATGARAYTVPVRSPTMAAYDGYLSVTPPFTYTDES
jgi:hypothetical protein